MREHAANVPADWHTADTAAFPERSRTLGALIDAFMTEKVSTFHGLRYHVRVRHRQFLDRIKRAHGDVRLDQIRPKTILEWYDLWSENKAKVSIGHAFIGHLRTVMGFGIVILEDEECGRIKTFLREMRFKNGQPRKHRLTFQQVNLIRAKAHELGYPSIALANALQFEVILRQKDVIGEWVPLIEPGVSEVTWHGKKWITGLRWNEIDAGLVLRHTTSKKGKDIEFPLGKAPMVIEELHKLAQRNPAKRSGPIIICEYTGRPWVPGEFRRKWRIIARAAGVPDHTFNMDSRSGGITEAFEAGADPDKIRKNATHAQLSQTLDYNRGSQFAASDDVIEKRVAARPRD